MPSLPTLSMMVVLVLQATVSFGIPVDQGNTRVVGRPAFDDGGSTHGRRDDASLEGRRIAVAKPVDSKRSLPTTATDSTSGFNLHRRKPVHVRVAYGGDSKAYVEGRLHARATSDSLPGPVRAKREIAAEKVESPEPESFSPEKRSPEQQSSEATSAELKTSGSQSHGPNRPVRDGERLPKTGGTAANLN